MNKDDRIFILCGDYGITNSFNRIFDRIWTNANTGHSFEIVKKEKREECDGKSVGGFDGDGWDAVVWQIHGEASDSVFEAGDWETGEFELVSKNGNGKGDNLLIVKGSRSGIESLQKIFDNAMSELEKEDSEYASIKLFSDDSEKIYLGSVYKDEGSDGFGFYVVLDADKRFDNPIELMQKLGMEINFYRR